MRLFIKETQFYVAFLCNQDFIKNDFCINKNTLQQTEIGPSVYMFYTQNWIFLLHFLQKRFFSLAAVDVVLLKGH